MKSVQIARTEKKLITHSPQRPLMLSMPSALLQPKHVRYISTLGAVVEEASPGFETLEKREEWMTRGDEGIRLCTLGAAK
jgi:hypothetical protein